MNSATSDYQQLIENELEPVIFNIEGLMKFREVCSFNGKENYPIHIELDTGMHRLGFTVDEIAGLCEKIDSRETSVKSVFLAFSRK